ncbi:MAG TPA: nucleotidyl transferase AbiEii/AbiGii toxin family protein [Streptosporangiaceae bacterium]|nr:nucleotidyl transferase AbiEii/AbiGii toxin family protein [Streptosporangiaceae bacterium]
MAGEGTNISEYDPSLATAILGEAAHLLRHLGLAARHTILIGGLVPGLLVLDPGPGRPVHAGTTDLDFCLSLAIVEGDTAQYERIETSLKAAGYRPTDTTFCWQRQAGLRLKAEFLCPAAEGRPAGKAFRPKAADEPVVKHNMGSRLSAIALDAGAAVSADIQVVAREVDLPDGAGRMSYEFRVSGLVGFLVAKVGALTERDKPKDAYDIVWLLESWPGGPEAAAEAARRSPAYLREDARSALDRLAEEFADPGRLGPRSYARFVVPQEASADDAARAARQAVGAVRTFTTALSR